MRRALLWALAGWVTIAPVSLSARQNQSLQGGEGASSGIPVEIVARAVSPASIEMGDEALERLVVTAPEGVTLEVVDRGALTGAESAERLGAWRFSRSPTDQGEVVWTFTAPLTAWTAGAHRTPPLTVTVRQGGQVRQILQEGPLPFRVSSPLPAGARVLRPTPPLHPVQQPPTWPGLLAVLPALAAVGSGFAWLRGRGSQTIQEIGDAPKHTPPPVDLGVVMAGVEGDPARAVIAAADAVRRHPRLVGIGVREAHTSADVVALGAGREDMAGVEALLGLADAAKYAGYDPTAQEVTDAVAPLLDGFSYG